MSARASDGSASVSRDCQRHSSSQEEADAPAKTTEDGSPSKPESPLPMPMSDRLREEVRMARKNKEEEELLEVIADNSGWSLEQMEQQPESIDFIELFLLTIPRIPVLKLFPNITLLKLMHIGLQSMQDLSDLTQIEELWLCDNEIRKIEGLQKMTKLRRLYLQENRITSLDGLPPLKHLRDLWLCRNKIRTVNAERHLYNVRKLRTLWLAGNPICSLEGSFRSFLSHLREVNLAGCEIYSFDQVSHLRPLSATLKKLWFADPIFGENPICRLNNYFTFTAQLLESLEVLDLEEISNEQRAQSSSVFDSKYIYYSMRLHTLDRNYELLRTFAQRLAADKQAEAVSALDRLEQVQTPIQWCVKERQAYHGKSSAPAALRAVPVEELQGHERVLSAAAGTREVQLQGVAKKLAEAVLLSQAMQTRLKERLCVELHSGGNVRLDEVLPAQASAGAGAGTPPTTAAAGANGRVWQKRRTQTGTSAPAPLKSHFENASELLQNGFALAAGAFKDQFGITGVEVNRVFRVVNRGLRLRFDDRIRTLEVDLTNQSNKRKMVCLFSPVPSDTHRQGAFLQHVLLRGMDAPSRRKGDSSKSSANTETAGLLPAASEGVPLTNSLFLADEERLLACQRQGELAGVNANPNAVSGQLVVSRVFLGKSVQALGGRAGGASRGSVAQSGGADDASRARSSGTPDGGGFLSSQGKVLLKDYSEDVFSVYRIPVGDTSKPSDGGASANLDLGGRVWYCLDRAVILPEFVIDYTYVRSSPDSLVPRAPSMSALSLITSPSMTEGLRARLESAIPSLKGQSAADSASFSAVLTDWTDLCTSCYHLLAFVESCKDGAVGSQLAEQETSNAIQSCQALLADAGLASVPSDETCSNSTSTPQRSSYGSASEGQDRSARSSVHTEGPAPVPLTSEMVDAYCKDLDANGSLTVCGLQRRGLVMLSQDFSSSAFEYLATLDLSSNAIAAFSWSALARAAPNLEALYLQRNRLTHLELGGAKLERLTTLNLAFNKLTEVHEFGALAESCRRLQRLYADGNPMLRGRKNCLALLLSVFSACPLETLNHLNVDGLSKPSVTRWKKDRTLDVSDAPTVRCLVQCAAQATDRLTCSPAGELDSKTAEGESEPVYCMLSLDPSCIPDRVFETALQATLHQTTDDSTTDRGRRLQRNAASTTEGATRLPTLHSFVYNYSLLSDVSSLLKTQQQSFAALRHLKLRGHNITDLSAVQSLPQLETLDLEDNCITDLPDLTALSSLATLNVSFNEVCTLATLGTLKALRCLCATGNCLSTLDSAFLCQLNSLRELYVSHNRLDSLRDFYPLKDMPHLVTLDVAGNPLSQTAQIPSADGAAAQDRRSGEEDRPASPDAPTTRMYFIYLFRRLKVLNGEPIAQVEVQRARDVFAGKISADLLTERASAPAAEWMTVTELDLSNCALQEVSLMDAFASLRVLNLRHNALTRVDGVSPLRNLRALDLSFNRLGTTAAQTVGNALRVLSGLESLSLEANHITDLNNIGLQLPKLLFLNLKGNELQFLDRGLQKLPELREVILDQNKLRSFSADCFAACQLLTDLSAEENALRATDGLCKLSRLQRLRLGVNRLGELQQFLKDAQNCPLEEAALLGNPIARKSNYHSAVIAAFPHLVRLDGKAISPDERERSEAAARQSSQFVVPANVVIDLSYVSQLAATAQQQQQQLLLPNAAGPAAFMPPVQGSAAFAVHGSARSTSGANSSSPPRLQPLSAKRPSNTQGGRGFAAGRGGNRY